MNELVILAWILGIGLVLVGLAGIFLPGVPGTPLVFLGLVTLAWIHDFSRVGWPTLAVLGALTAFSYVADFVTLRLGVRRFGATKTAGWGALAGLVIGLFFGLPGIIVGPFIGAFVGELVSVGDLRQAGRAGLGTWLGLALGVVLKVALAFGMVGIFIAAYWL